MQLRRHAAGPASALLLAFGASFLAGCGRDEPPAADARPNVVLISIDTLRADHLGAYGYERPTSPNLDRLAAEGVLFENAVAPSPWTLPSHASMLTGLVPARHGVLDADRVLPGSIPTLAETLREAGVRTAAFVNVTYLGPRNGLSRGFEDFRHFDEMRMELSGPPAIAAIRTWLDAHGERPFFLFFHSFDVHSDYRPGPEQRELFVRPYAGPMDGTTAQIRRIREGEYTPTPEDIAHLRDLYDGAIRLFDERLGELFAELDRRGLTERTWIVVTSDHGEEFFEHGGVLHGRTLYEEVIRVPLIVRGPGAEAGRRVEALAQLVDVPNTILALFGAPPLDPTDGIDLGPFLRAGAPPPDGAADRAALLEAAPWKLWRGAQTHLVGARTQRLKAIHDLGGGATQLFDLARDPAERSDVAAAQPEALLPLRALIDRYAALARGEAGAVALTPEQVEQLRALGYAN